MSAVKWNDDSVLRFVKLYKERPCLWQSDHPRYKCKKTRSEALRSLVRDMDLDGFDLYACKMKIKNMRSYYCHKLRKVHRRRADDHRYEPSLVWFPYVHEFLNKYINCEKIVDDSNEESECFDFVDVSMQSEDKERKGKTEFDAFGRSVALHLNELPAESALRLQRNIQNLIIEERLRCLRSA